MVRTFVVIATLAVLAACNGPVRDVGGSGGSPANFSFRSDDQHALATIAAAEHGKPATWKVSAESFGTVTPAAVQFADRGGRLCRGLTQARTTGAQTMNREVTACHSGDGIWVVTDHPVEKAD